MPNPSQADVAVPLSAKLAADDPQTGHADWETKIGTGIYVVTRLLSTNVFMVRIKGDLSEIAGYGTEWEAAVVDLLKAHRDWENIEGLAT